MDAVWIVVRKKRVVAVYTTKAKALATKALLLGSKVECHALRS